jgi:hypothetical protein
MKSIKLRTHPKNFDQQIEDLTRRHNVLKRKISSNSTCFANFLVGLIAGTKHQVGKINSGIPEGGSQTEQRHGVDPTPKRTKRLHICDVARKYSVLMMDLKKDSRACEGLRSTVSGIAPPM